MTNQTTSDLLRRAAAKLRGHAEAATRGPWQAVRYGNGWGVDGDVRPADHAWMAEMKFGEERADAEYIALMHPPVALAVAGLLDFEAGEWDEYGTPRRGIVAVAQAVLGVPVHEAQF